MRTAHPTGEKNKQLSVVMQDALQCVACSKLNEATKDLSPADFFRQTVLLPGCKNKPLENLNLHYLKIIETDVIFSP
ncbi:hypothetical protein [Undibacterium sp. TC4M20W]|uniref:hypothetical protein n=1 Tax=Undibacterium sp. TC4M20W TaxID=3413052 RepID=UPI003BF45FE9